MKKGEALHQKLTGYCVYSMRVKCSQTPSLKYSIEKLLETTCCLSKRLKKGNEMGKKQ